MTYYLEISAVEQAAGKAFVTARDARRAPVRKALTELAGAIAGVPHDSVVFNASADDTLCTIYAMARSKNAGTARGAASMAKSEYAKQGGTLDGTATPAPTPAPTGGIDVKEIEARLTATIEARVRAEIEARQATELVVTVGDAPTVKLGVVHEQVPTLIRLMAKPRNVYLYGPAGSGKTTAGQQIADAVGQPFYFCGKVDSEYALLGFTSANGTVVRTPFREAYEHGGLFLFDEFDRSNESAAVALNAALANGVCAFPDAVVPKHPEFRCIASGNTTMSGGDSQYTAGVQQDASVIDRFLFLPFGYDENLERKLASDPQWCNFVQSVRAALAERGSEHAVTPRATYEGCKLLADGFTYSEVAKMAVFKGLESDIVEAVLMDVPLPLDASDLLD